MLDILFQDEALVAVNKPSGLLVHRSMIDKHETEFAMQMVRDQIGQHVYPVHRLDKPTSGVLVFALSANIARLLSTQIEQHRWQKAYTAIVRGWAKNCDIDYALKEKLDKITDKKANTEKPAQEAFTRVVNLCHFLVPVPVGRYQQARFSLIHCFPKTGRKHQIRRHCAHINHPIVGDTTIGDGKQNASDCDIGIKDRQICSVEYRRNLRKNSWTVFAINQKLCTGLSGVVCHTNMPLVC